VLQPELSTVAIPPPRASGSSAASLAHSSAFSFPGTPLWAGHHRISIMMPGLALLSAAMWLARVIWLGLGSSEAMRLIATWASVKIVTRSGAVCHLVAVSSALARAAHSAS
jgi:hypothetical protein